MVSTRPPQWPQIVGCILGFLAAAALALIGALFALFVDLMRCDEGCSDQPLSWHEDADAWQWDAQLAVAGVAVLCALWAAVAIARGRWRSATYAGMAAVSVWAIWWVWATGF